MTWHLRYQKDGTNHITWHPSPEAAIETACRLIDDSYDVCGIGTEMLVDTISRGEIARIYAFWARAMTPLN